MSKTNQTTSHCRYNPMLDEWMVVSPHRCNRPWKGEISAPQKFDMPEYDPKNPLCPRNTRQNGETNPDYESTFLFDNDFPALQPIDIPDEAGIEKSWENEDDNQNQSSKDKFNFYVSKPATGKCRVMCFHPKTNITIPLMTKNELLKIINTWADEVDQLSKKYCYVQVFENKGAMMGCSNPHPHCQIWASNFYPNVIQKKINSFTKYFEQYNSPMLLDYARTEMENDQGKDRILYICPNKNWLVLVPYWAMWPFESLVIFIGRPNIYTFSQLTENERLDLGLAMKTLTTRYDNLFKCSFSYSMGFQIAPNLPEEKFKKLGWQFHAHYFPPLLRSATVKKHVAGYELLAQPQRDLTPEMACKKLMDVDGEIHYTKNLEN